MYEPLMSIQTILPKHYEKLLCKIPVCLKINIFHFSLIDLFAHAIHKRSCRSQHKCVTTGTYFNKFAPLNLHSSKWHVGDAYWCPLEGRHLRSDYFYFTLCWLYHYRFIVGRTNLNTVVRNDYFSFKSSSYICNSLTQIM